MGRSVIRVFLTRHAVFLNIKCILAFCAIWNQCHAAYSILEVYIGSVDELNSGPCYPARQRAIVGSERFLAHCDFSYSCVRLCGVDKCVNRQKDGNAQGKWGKCLNSELSTPERTLSSANEVTVGRHEHC